MSKPFDPTDRPGKKFVWLQSMAIRAKAWQCMIRHRVSMLLQMRPRNTLWKTRKRKGAAFRDRD